MARESRAAEADVSSESQASIEDRELSPILHEEIERLPAKYRAPIVLCYLEGMTHDQAAVELGWPVGTVRGRLARARDLLKSRLTRRGLAVSAGLAASGSPADAAAAGLSAALVDATVRAALGRSTVAGLSRTAALLLKAVLRDMAVARWIRLAAPLAADRRPRGRRGHLPLPGRNEALRRASVHRRGSCRSRGRPRPTWRATRSPTAPWPGSGPPASRPGR